MEIILKEVVSRHDLREFIFLPEKIHRGHSNWLPPIYMDEWNFFDGKKNPSFKYCDTKLLLAQKDGKTVGRIMGIIHHKHNEVCNLKRARFGYLECYEDYEIFSTLLKAIKLWAKEKGMDSIIGPYGFSDKDVQGFLISGFDQEPVIDSACNFPYMGEFMERAGFKKDVDCLIYHYDLNTPVPAAYERIFSRITTRENYAFIEFTSKRQLKPYIIPIFETVNEGFKNIYGFVHMEDCEIQAMVKQYLSIIDPRFVKVITFKNEVVGFIIALPTFTKGTQKARGRIFPFGFYHIFKAMRNAEKCDLMLGAIKPEFQKKGLDLFLSYSIIQTSKKLNYKYIDTHTVLEHNDSMTGEMIRFGAKEIKRFRVYIQNLS
jgi:hypothetical protein